MARQLQRVTTATVEQIAALGGSALQPGGGAPSYSRRALRHCQIAASSAASDFL